MNLPEPIAFLPGRLLADPAWLSGRIDGAVRFWRTSDRGIAATLWWYSAATILLGPPVHAFMETGRASSIRPDDVRFTLTGYGDLERVVISLGTADVAEGPQSFGEHLDDALLPILTPLAAVGAVPIQRLWALASDALGNRLLAEWRRRRGAPIGPMPLMELARSIAIGSKRLRSSDYDSIVAGGPPVLYLHRGSCCMIYRLPGNPLCISCPRQDPDIRRLRLERHAKAF